ncbi:NADH dehydrogenase, alpha subcomplex, subunit 8 [Coniophora puteana RWD-64-598 SS2]|uniref:NADH-ubiquinone oxidoreductase n=1 Tax=Coniophora puteana (strain RWD-64-598) TaxID=741705 RepID=A0A5M3MAT8_CONPW|nr:NADH dehydrogenase, alpha subcomplex, subunit 8 [Coniophora puteana RWD-64-598 SS2]EIW76193.1 NADH dehydrogenase, alpha subcomplex, subunit 8 [Coniophora puteana RWD-64-598 SS2]
MTIYHAGDDSQARPYIDPTPLPDSIPKVQEIGTSSAPLKSAAFFIGAYCKDYNEDFMLCKQDAKGDPGACLKEGRKVTRCATDLINKMRENCLETFDKHWQCLELHNQEYYACRKDERALNKCMFEKLGLTKTIPGSPKGQTPIHDVAKPIYTTVQR